MDNCVEIFDYYELENASRHRCYLPQLQLVAEFYVSGERAEIGDAIETLCQRFRKRSVDVYVDLALTIMEIRRDLGLL